MSLTETDEQRAYYKGRLDGTDVGYLKAIREIRKWIENDCGVIPVNSIRTKLSDMEGRVK